MGTKSRSGRVPRGYSWCVISSSSGADLRHAAVSSGWWRVPSLPQPTRAAKRSLTLSAVVLGAKTYWLSQFPL